MRPYCYLVVPAMTFYACSAGNSSYEATLDSTTVASESNSYTKAVETAAQAGEEVPALNSPARKHVRTADVNVRVANVFSAATTLEHVTKGMDGYVVESTLSNELGAAQDIPYKGDSMKHVQLYTAIANLTLKVPAAQLDSLVSTLNNVAVFVSTRTLKDDDKTLEYLKNFMKNEEPLTPVAVTKKSDPLQTATYQDEKKDEKVERKIANFAILDDANYATLKVQLSQSEQADVQIVVNPESVTRARFGTELLTALSTGTTALRNVVLFFLQLWPFVLLAIAGVIGYRKLASKKVVVAPSKTEN
ncbi:DUF4349 domain-containing protein [Chitinophaga sancti]|uniref:DUF4349 domain-containing protein n=1 Tax=Chitinophaga sancti TaxID=1004 RepID=A0A1K1NAS8_9BACT|nr:DUF4349 domain-containing protein [Chitinophaga sancti]WQD63389.1 DUF4349 domain-containing protein [Chitinophaga sancti]WQG90985.1 DUF4349 domain-containing protein [Chitinophaga sancti]SFW32560.1 protein of unknown function [Chitinophaga sancti]